MALGFEGRIFDLRLPTQGAKNISDNTQRFTSHYKPSSIYFLVLTIAVAMLMLKVLASIVLEYRFYFPPNFDAAFLVGREKSFVGIYRIAFYSHIISGPAVVILAVTLLLTGGRSRFRILHRWLGRSLVLIVLASIVPSGFVMSQYALSGPVAGIGFALQTFATATTAIAAIWFARAKMYSRHKRWAIRCFILCRRHWNPDRVPCDDLARRIGVHYIASIDLGRVSI